MDWRILHVARKALNPASASRFAAWLPLGLGIASLPFVGWVNVDALIEAFAEGAPCYGRTTNIDKWENPLPILVTIDLIVIALVTPAMRWAIRTLVDHTER